MTEYNQETGLPVNAAKPGFDVGTSLNAVTAASVVRSLTLVLTSFAAIVGFVGARDLSGLINWLRGQDGLSFISLLIAVATFAYGQWLRRRERARFITAAAFAPNSVATIKDGKP